METKNKNNRSPYRHYSECHPLTQFVNTNSLEAKLNELRNEGLIIAVHNDYCVRGTKFTFYLFTKQIGIFTLSFKGEADTDLKALDEVLIEYNKLKNTFSELEKI